MLLPSRLPLAGPNSVLPGRQKNVGVTHVPFERPVKLDRSIHPQPLPSAGHRRLFGEALVDIVVEDPLELLDQSITTQGAVEPADATDLSGSVTCRLPLHHGAVDP